LEKRKKSIQKINNFSNQREICFNQLLIEELGSTHKPIPRISKFFLSLAFSKRQRKERRIACCDGCWRAQNDGKASNFTREVVAILGLPNQRLP